MVSPADIETGSARILLLFPFNYMESAGYIATSANYLYPFVGVLVILRLFVYILENEKTPFYMYIAVALSIIYTTNQDQTAIALLAGLVIYLIYCRITKADKRLTRNIIGVLIGSLASYIFYFLLPGHLGRMTGESTEEMDIWFPEYIDWTFGDKVFHGYTSTVANALFNDVLLVTLFAALLLIISLRQKTPYKIIVGAMPFAGIMISHFMDKGQFIYYFPRSIGMPELMPIEVFAFPFILSVVILGCLFWGIWLNVNKLENKLMLTLLLVLAAGTREMMGFTATIYASSFRTFTFFLYAIIIGCIIFLNELEEDNEHKHLWYMGVGAILALLTI